MLQVGDIILFRGTAWYSKYIKKLTWSEYSHAAIYLGHGLVVESDWNGVQVNALSDKYKDANYSTFRHIEASKEQLQFATDWMLSQVGAGYDYKGIFGILISIIGKGKTNLFDEKNNYWCSELAMDGYHKAGIATSAPLKTWRWSPGDIGRDKYFQRL